MAIKYSDVERAFDYVSFGPPCENCAYIHRKTGQTFYSSEMTGESDIPEEAYEDDDYLEVPHKNDLDMGQRLVERFIDREAPQLAGEVRRIFSRRGAYSRYKDLLAGHKLLEKWHDFEADSMKQAIGEKCPICHFWRNRNRFTHETGE